MIKPLSELTEEEAIIRQRNRVKMAVSSYAIENVELDEEELFQRLMGVWARRRKAMLEKRELERFSA